MSLDPLGLHLSLPLSTFGRGSSHTCSACAQLSLRKAPLQGLRKHTLCLNLSGSLLGVRNSRHHAPKPTTAYLGRRKYLVPPTTKGAPGRSPTVSDRSRAPLENAPPRRSWSPATQGSWPRRPTSTESQSLMEWTA